MTPRTDKQKLDALKRYAQIVVRNRTLEAADNEGIRQWQKGRAAAARYFLAIIEAGEEEDDDDYVVEGPDDDESLVIYDDGPVA